MPLADSNFLIPNSTLFVELLAFLIVLFVIGKYVLPPLKKALDVRAELIRSELEAADEAKADANAADEERRGALEAARQQAREIVAQANRTAETVRSDSQANAQAEHDRIVNNAATEVALARQTAPWRKRPSGWARSSWTSSSASSGGRSTPRPTAT